MLGILALPLFFNLSSATITKGTPFFNLSSSICGPSQPIEGFVNFSLNNQDSDIKISVNSSSFLKSLKLIDFLKKSSAVFTCNPSSCLPIYSFVSGSEQESKNFDLENSDKLLGIKIQGLNNVEIKNLSFIIRGSSNQEFTCSESFVRLDVLDDDAINYEYTSPNENNNCTDFTNSCFSMSNTVDFDLDSNPKCEKIFIEKTGKVDIGAYVTLSSGDPSQLVMTLYDPKTAKKYNCTIGETEGVLTGFNFCSINSENNPNFFIDEARDVYVCISNQGTGLYSIKGESDYPCGFLGSPESFNGNFLFDYPIYIRYYGFSPIRGGEEILFWDSNFRSETSESLMAYIQDYINSRYSGNCLSGCIIPINFIANGKQSLVISDLELKFTSNPGGPATIRTFWDITKTPVSVTMPNSVFSLNAFNISAPSAMGDYKFILTLGTSSSIPFKVSNVPIIQSLTPLFISPNKPTTFYASVQQFQNPISNYTWDWGDGSQETTLVPSASHTYSEGSFTLTLKVIDSSSLMGIRSFLINTTITKQALNQTYLEKKQAYQSLASLGDSWYLDLLINKTLVNSSLNEVATLLETSNDLFLIKGKLDLIMVPVSLNDTQVLPESNYYPNVESVSFDKLSELGAGQYDSYYKEGMLNELLLWQDQVTLKLSGRVKQVVFDDSSTQEITLLTIRIIPPVSEEVYFIYDLPASLNKAQIMVKENIAFLDLGSSIGAKFSEDETINIALPIKQSLAQQTFYVSPSLSILVKEQDSVNPTSKPSLVLPIIVLVIIFLALVVLLFLIWKKKLLGSGSKSKSSASNSEDLFANPSDLMSLISYIQTSQQEGKNKKIIEKELLDSGWTKAQIKYAYENMGTDISSFSIQ